MQVKILQILKKIIFRVLLVFISLFIFVILAELAVRILSNIQPPLKIKDREIGEKYIPNYSKKIFINESQQYVTLKFNKDGFRGKNRSYKKPQNTCRIAILGDSQIAAIATKTEETLVYQLEKKLNQQHPDITWEVFNFGITAASTAQELVLFRKLVTKYNPDIVICAYYIGNDFSDNYDKLSTYPRIYMDMDQNGDLYVKPFLTVRKKISTWLNRHSRFYVWQKHTTNILADKLKKSDTFYKVREGKLIFMNKDSKKLNYAWKLNEKIIHTFHKEVLQETGYFLFVVIPNSHQLYHDRWKSFVVKDPDARPYLNADYPDQKLSEILKKKNIDSVFLRRRLEDYIDNRPHYEPDAQVLYNGTGHLNEKGQKIATETIYKYLLDNGTIRYYIDIYKHNN